MLGMDLQEFLDDISAFSRTASDWIIAKVPEEWLNGISGLMPESVDAWWVGVATLILTILLLWLLVRLIRRKQAKDATPHLSDLTRGPRLAGYIITLVLVVGLGTWSFRAPLEGAAIANGVISPEGYRRTIQHLEGGIIRAIHVREGDLVTEGQVLLTLDDVEARAHLDEQRNRYTHLLARATRLEAELRGSDVLDVPLDDSFSDRAELGLAVASQQELLARRIETRNGRDAILQQRIRQLEEENIGLDQAIAGLDEKAQLIGEEVESVADLLQRGLERRNRLLELKRAAADVRIDRATSKAQIARNKQSMGETEIQLLTMHQQEIEDITEELAEVRRAMAELGSELRWRADVVERTEVRSPIAGTVMNVRVTTLSGIVRTGEPILDIVPSHVPLIIEARVNPTDIDVIKVGMRARIHLSAFQQRNMPQVFGFLLSISADRLVDERSGEAYYLAKIEVPTSQLENMPDVELVSGMPADVMLLTGKSSVADYVLGPLMGSIRRSFRENHSG